MDLFYKAPLQRRDECKALEENYMNCMLQKVLKDHVQNNRCKLDSILWFHLECPLDADKFNDPVHFKRKWRNFFAETKATADLLLSRTAEEKRIEEQYSHVPYPEDSRENIKVRAFPDEFKHLNPAFYDDLDIDEGEDEMTLNEEAPMKDQRYGRAIPGFERDGEKIELNSAKWGGDAL